MDWAYNNAEPTNLLEDLATRAVVHYLAGVDLNDVMSHARLEAAQELRESDSIRRRMRVSSARKFFLSACRTFIRRSKVAADYEKVVGASRQMIAKTNMAVADAISTNALAGAVAFTTTNVAEAARMQLETSALGARGVVHQPDSGV